MLDMEFKLVNRSDDVTDTTAVDFVIFYGSKNEIENALKGNFLKHINNVIFIVQSEDLFGPRYLQKESIPLTICKYNYDKNEKPILSLYNDNEELYIIRKVDENKHFIETNIDIISDIFFMLTRYEEYVLKDQSTDKHSRFMCSSSIAYKFDFLDRPIVNEHVNLLWDFIDSFGLGYNKKVWWGNNSYAVCLSHDVDNIVRFNSFKELLKVNAIEVLRYKKVNKAIHNTLVYIKSKLDYKKDDYWSFEQIIDMETKYNMKSTFNFMTGGDTCYDNFYKIEDKRVVNLIREMENNNFEVGFHGSFNSYSSEEFMKRERFLLDRIVSDKGYGCRQHYLRFSVPTTWEIQESLGLLYDSTLTFAEYEGYRCGICFPYKPYSLRENRVLNMWEIPLIVMEGTLENKDYRNYNVVEAFESILKHIETVKKHNGVFTLLWHNSTIRNECESWGKLYEEVLRHISQDNSMCVCGKELIKKIEKGR
jgi:peptidoglycan/xylan/chitin deacetylase (PgdA/CDA1 family)